MVYDKYGYSLETGIIFSLKKECATFIWKEGECHDICWGDHLLKIVFFLIFSLLGIDTYCPGWLYFLPGLKLEGHNISEAER